MGLTPDVVNGGRSSSTWANEIRDRTVQLFTDITELAGWAAPDGASARTLNDGLWWARYQGEWTEVVLLGPQGETGAPGQATIIVGEFGPGGKLPADLPPDGLIPVDWDGAGRPSVAHQMIPGESLYYRSALGPTDPIDGHLFQFVGTAHPAGWLDIGLVRGPVGPEGAEGPMGPQGAVGPDEVIISSGAPSATTADLWVDVGDSTTGGSYLPLAGGDMEADAVIAWPDGPGVAVGGPRLVLWPEHTAPEPTDGIYGFGIEDYTLAAYIGGPNSKFTVYAGDEADRTAVFLVSAVGDVDLYGGGQFTYHSAEPNTVAHSGTAFYCRTADGPVLFSQKGDCVPGPVSGDPLTSWAVTVWNENTSKTLTFNYNGDLLIPGSPVVQDVQFRGPEPTDGSEPSTSSLLDVIAELRARIAALEAR